MIAAFIIMSCIFLLIQYSCVLMLVLNDKGYGVSQKTFKTKKFLYLNLVPFYFVYLGVVYISKSLSEALKEIE